MNRMVLYFSLTFMVCAADRLAYLLINECNPTDAPLRQSIGPVVCALLAGLCWRDRK